MSSKVFVYPKLHAMHHFIIRFRGSGLANCLFVYARALILADKNGLPILNPSWVQFNLGPYLRREKDKRHYNGLFKSFGVKYFKKHWLLLTQKSLPENLANTVHSRGLVTVEGLGNYFADLHHHSDLIKNHLLSIVNDNAFQHYQLTEGDFIGIHIRLGDYDPESRISLDWYLDMMTKLCEFSSVELKFLVFSDGTPAELIKVLDFPNTSMAYFGSAIADILVLSKAKLIIASDSTFSAWAGYLGQVPLLFCKRHFGPVLDNQDYEWVEGQQSAESINIGLKKVLG